MTIAKKFADRIDMRFKYRPAASTNVEETFARRRKELAEAKAAAEAAEQERGVKVRKLK